MLKAVRENGHVTYKADLPELHQIVKARRSWADVIHTLREHKCQTRLLYPAKLSITTDGENKIFRDKTKFIQYSQIQPYKG